MNAAEKNENDHLKWQHYLISILFILVGVVFIVYTQIDIPMICKVSSIVFGVAGIISIITYCVKDVAVGYYRLDLVYGAMALVAALLFITYQDTIQTYFQVIAGMILIGNGVIKLQHSIDMKRIDRKMKKITEAWLVVMIFALIGTAVGFVMLYLTPQKPRTMFILVGLALIIAGVSDIFTNIVFNKKVKAFRNGDYIVEPVQEAPVTKPEETPAEPEKEQDTDIKETMPEEEISEGETSEENKESDENNTDAADQIS